MFPTSLTILYTTSGLLSGDWYGWRVRWSKERERPPATDIATDQTHPYGSNTNSLPLIEHNTLSTSPHTHVIEGLASKNGEQKTQKMNCWIEFLIDPAWIDRIYTFFCEMDIYTTSTYVQWRFTY
jgi:hypothetical protein